MGLAPKIKLDLPISPIDPKRPALGAALEPPESPVPLAPPNPANGVFPLSGRKPKIGGAAGETELSPAVDLVPNGEPLGPPVIGPKPGKVLVFAGVVAGSDLGDESASLGAPEADTAVGGLPKEKELLEGGKLNPDPVDDGGTDEVDELPNEGVKPPNAELDPVDGFEAVEPEVPSAKGVKPRVGPVGAGRGDGAANVELNAAGLNVNPDLAGSFAPVAFEVGEVVVGLDP